MALSFVDLPARGSAYVRRVDIEQVTVLQVVCAEIRILILAHRTLPYKGDGNLQVYSEDSTMLKLSMKSFNFWVWE